MYSGLYSLTTASVSPWLFREKGPRTFSRKITPFSSSTLSGLPAAVTCSTRSPRDQVGEVRGRFNLAVPDMGAIIRK